MLTNYRVSDYIVGAQNCIEAAGISSGETVLLLGDHRSDPLTMEALEVALTALGAEPMLMLTEPVRRYGGIPAAAMEAMVASDVVIWVWPVFLTFTEEYRNEVRLKREREEYIKPGAPKMRPYFVYFEGTPGLMATDYARFPNELLWLIAAKLRDVVSAGTSLRVESDRGTKLEATYNGKKLYGMQFGPGDPPGRCHFPWGRCGIFNGEGSANGTVYIDCVQGVPGRLYEPLGWRVEDNIVTEVISGGEMADHCKALFKKFPDSNHLIEIMFGYHPKASVARGIEDPMHWELISKMPWAGIGMPRGSKEFRHIDGSVLNSRLYVDDELLVDQHGRLSLLGDEEIREAAARYGDPDAVLGAVAHEGQGAGAVW